MVEALIGAASGLLVGIIGALTAIWVKNKEMKSLYTQSLTDLERKLGNFGERSLKSVIGIDTEDSLSRQHDALHDAIGGTRQVIGEVAQAVTAIDRRAETERAVQEARERLLDPQQLHMKEAVDKILSLSENWQKLIVENAQLRGQVTSLHAKIAVLDWEALEAKGHHFEPEQLQRPDWEEELER